jgi:chromosomal replication initiation ATPase DnaA
MKRIEIVINESNHGMLGVGDIVYDYSCNSDFKKLTINFTDLNFSKIYTGEKAKSIMTGLMKTEDEHIQKAKQIASDACNIPEFRLYEKTRKAPVVFARNLVIWYCLEYVNSSPAFAGRIFEKDHATAIHAKNVIEKDYKYLSDDQAVWKKRFMNKIKENYLDKEQNSQ